MTNKLVHFANANRVIKGFRINRLIGLLVTVIAITILSGCGLTAQPEVITVDTNVPLFERMKPQCIEQVQAQQSSPYQKEASQHLSLASTAQYCFENIQFSPQHPDIQTAMHFSALAVVNYVKAGDILAARKALSQFRTKFPQQDLLFEDYTSFVDTATVLVKQDEVTLNQLAYLNINPALRAEIKRQRRWSLN